MVVGAVVDPGAVPEVVGATVVLEVVLVVVDEVDVEVTDSVDVVVMITTGMVAGAATEVAEATAERVEGAATSAEFVFPPPVPAHEVANSDPTSRVDATRWRGFTGTTVQPRRRPRWSSHEPISTSVASVAV